jgi:Zn-dependent peptidase ImmA (M78 family)/DNA-binding XRE family transcriptional regulator
MAAAEMIAVNPSLLVWAREESGYPIDRVAKRLQVKEERVSAWEKGELRPTLRQVEELAHFFHRPLSVFFMSRPPQLPPLAAEYRRVSGVEPGQESPELRLALRQMVTRRENALNLMGELGDRIPEFALRASLRESPAEVGQRLRHATGIDLGTQIAWRDQWQAWREWRASIERLGILVFQFPKVNVDEVRGLALLRTPLPAVGINGKELPEARIYTLFHEVVHLMLAVGNEEVPAIRERRPIDEWTRVERFAEMAASHAIIPEGALRATIENFGLQRDGWSVAGVRRLAKNFRLTPLAIATRLRESAYMTWTQYNEWRERWQEYVASLPPRRPGGFATPVEKSVNRAGQPFAKLVLEALSANRITPVDASRYLDLKFEHFDKLKTHLMSGPGDTSFDE